jgi:hypothetical protein
VRVAADNQAVVDASGVVLLCLRPQDAPDVVSQLAFRAGQTVISAMAGVALPALRRLVAPADDVVRVIPLPAVAERAGLTATHPSNERARAIFDALGGVIVAEDEPALDALSAATATISAHMAYLGTIVAWLAEQGIGRGDATSYLAAVFGGLSGTLLADAPADFEALAPRRLNRGFAVRQLPAGPREVAGVAVGEALEVVLVLRLGLPERDGLADLGHDLAGPDPRGLDVGDRVLRDLALLVARVEDLRPVTRADVVALAILGRRVVDLEEELEDVPVGDAVGIEDDLDGLGVAGVIPIRGVLVLAAGVADAGGEDAVFMAQQVLDAPEAASREDGGLGPVGHRAVLSSKLGIRFPF